MRERRLNGKQCRGSYAEIENRDRTSRDDLEDIFFFFFGAHGKKCRGDDHSEKYQCKNKIVDHWGVSFWRLWPSWSNHLRVTEGETSHIGLGEYD